MYKLIIICNDNINNIGTHVDDDKHVITHNDCCYITLIHFDLNYLE